MIKEKLKWILQLYLNQLTEKRELGKKNKIKTDFSYLAL